MNYTHSRYGLTQSDSIVRRTINKRVYYLSIVKSNSWDYFFINMKKFLMIIMATSIFVCHAKTSIKQMDLQRLQDSLRIEHMEDKLSIVDERVSDLHQLVDTSTSILSNEISASNNYLTVVSIILGIVTVVLGLYVTWMHSKIKTMTDTVSEKETIINGLCCEVEDKNQEVLRLKLKVEEVSKSISGKIEEIFPKLRREETMACLKRLTVVPEDISHIASILLSRKLEDDDYELLIQAIEILKGRSDEETISLYMSVLFQFFADKVVCDEYLRKVLLNRLDEYIDNCFPNDIEKSTNDVCNGIKNLPHVTAMKFIDKYMESLMASRYKDRDDIMEQLKKCVSPEEWKNIEQRIGEIDFKKRESDKIRLKLGLKI